MRKVLGGGSDSLPEVELEELVAERSHELEAQTAALEDAIADLERRESLVGDSRASLERLLRLGTSDLDSREAELAELIRELTVREERLQEAEAEVTRRRSELGAVELKRASIEQRERALAEREVALDDRERGLGELDRMDAPPASGPPVHATAVELVFLPGVRYRLVEIEPASVERGAVFAILDGEYLVARAGPSPLPGDARRCAYLVPVPPGSSGSS